MAANNINIPDVKNIVSHLNSLKDIKAVDVIKNIHTLKSIAPYIIEFYDISNKIFSSIPEISESVDKKIVDYQKSLIESINKSIETINKLNDVKLNGGVEFYIKINFLRNRISRIVDVFIGENGISQYLNQFSNLKQGKTVEVYNDNGKLVKKTTTAPINPTDVINGFKQLVDTVIEIVDNSKELSKNIIKSYNSLNVVWPMLIGGHKFLFFKQHPGIINRYVDLLGSNEFQYLQDKKIPRQINQVKDNINNINSIIENISGLSIMKSVVGLSSYNLYLSILFDIIRKVFSFPYVDNIDTKINNIKKISDFVSVINNIITDIIKFDISTAANLYISSQLIDGLIKNLSKILFKLSNFSQTIKSTSFAGIKPQITTIKNIINGILNITGEIYLLALSAAPLAIAVIPAELSLLIIAGIVWTIKGLFEKFSIDKEFETTQTAISNIYLIILETVGTILLTAGALLLISYIAPVLIKSAKDTALTTLAIAGVVLAIGGLAWIINKIFAGGIGNQISSGLLLMISLIGIMLLVTGQLILFAYAGLLMFGENWGGGLWLHAAAMFGMVATTTLLIGGIGYLLTLMLPGIIAFAASSISLLISIGAMLLVAGMLVGLAEFEFEEGTQEKVREKTKLIIDTAHDIMNAMFRGWTKDESGELTSNESEDGGFKRFFKGLFQGGAMVVEILASSLVLVMTFVSVTMLLATAAMLETIGKIDLNSPTITSNVGMVIGVAHGVIDAVLNKETPTTKDTPEDKKGPIRSLLSGVGDVFKGIKNIIDGVLSFGFIAFTMVSIGMITLIAKNLKYLEGIELNQKTVESKVQAVIGTANSLINHINESNINKDNVKKAELTKNFIKQIEKTVGYMSKIGEMNNQGQFDKAIDSYVRFVDKINTVKLENLQTATNMFEKMAEFSKSISGNFEGLANTINEKIMPLLEQLNEGLNKTNENIGNGSFGSTSATSRPAAPVSASAGTATNAPQKDYSRILGEIKQEISKMQKILTDGSQVTVVDTQ